MGEQKNQKTQDVNQLLKIRRDKLAELQADGKDPFQITKFDVTHHSQEVIYMKAASVSRMLFVMMCYIFFECYFNHLFGAGSTDIWILIYLIMSIAGMTTRNAESDGGENGANNGLYTDI